MLKVNINSTFYSNKINFQFRNREETRNRNMEDTNHMKMLLEAK